MRESLAPISTVNLSGSPGFNVVILYEDLETGKRARRTYDYLAEQLDRESNFNQAMWKFDVLAIPQLRDMAIRDATEADILVVSSRGGQQLPADVRDWLEHLLRLGCRPLVLVALFACDSGRAEGVRSYLAGLARRGGIKFFAQPERPASDEMPADPPGLRHRANGQSMNAFSGTMRHEVSIPRWGINE